MSDLRFCFEVNGLAKDEFGNPCPVGMELSLGEFDSDEEAYKKLAENISIPALLNLVCLTGLVKPEDVKLISPEEYDEKYSQRKRKR